MSAKHTPGPWVLLNIAMGHADHLNVWTESGIGHVAAVSKGLAPDPSAEANARLIAAAPELLQFAEWAMRQFCGDSGTGEAHWEQFPEFVAGQTAIAKATGKEGA